MPSQLSIIPPDAYEAFLSDLKSRIRTAQIKAALAVNQELVMLYWQIGSRILQQQQEEGWGTKVITQLAKDLKREFPEGKGFSVRNLKYMRAFAEAWADEAFVQQAAAQMPWFHNCVLLDKVKGAAARQWYIQQTIANGWSRNVLVMQIESDLYQRQGGAITNFERTLPQPQSDLAQQIIKDPYCFDFLTNSQDALERELERGLIEHIRDFLLELGVGFAFLGSQYPITVDEREYRMDLLFYHARLHCYVVIELKTKEFEPEHAGKMNFYVSAVNHLIRSEEDKPTIGIILCSSKRKNTVEFALDSVRNPIGVSTYTTRDSLPPDIQDSLPTAEQLEMEMEVAMREIKARTEEFPDLPEQ
jgi:predicted nuclease of restriction endonuclease-like (RecB) superfamily